MPVDHFKMSIVANNALCLPTKVKRYHPTSPDGTRPIRISRPLGLLRKPKRTLTDQQIGVCNRRNDDTIFDTDDEEETNSDAIELISKEDMEHHRPDEAIKKSKSSHRTKNRIFEQRYKIAASRTPRQDIKVRPVTSLYSKRVVYLPMFRINMERYTATQNDRKDVQSARQSLRELLHHGMKPKPKTEPSMVSATIQNFHFVTPGKEAENKDYTPRRLIFSQPISIPKTDNSEVGNDDGITVDIKAETKTQYQHFPSIGGSEDTDQMDIRIETLDINSEDESQQSETETKNISHTIGDIPCDNERDARVTGSSYKYNLSDDYKKHSDVNQEPVGWPSYSDVKRLRQGKQNGASRNGISNTKFSPVLRYTSRQNVLKLDPIVVPSHTNMTCPRCNIYIRESTPCPPNSPSISGSQESSFEDLDNNPDQHCHTHKGHGENDFYAQKPATPSKSASTKHPQELYVMPKVTVKILETREQLNEAKLNYTKSYH